MQCAEALEAGQCQVLKAMLPSKRHALFIVSFLATSVNKRWQGWQKDGIETHKKIMVYSIRDDLDDACTGIREKAGLPVKPERIFDPVLIIRPGLFQLLHCGVQRQAVFNAQPEIAQHAVKACC